MTFESCVHRLAVDQGQQAIAELAIRQRSMPSGVRREELYSLAELHQVHGLRVRISPCCACQNGSAQCPVGGGVWPWAPTISVPVIMSATGARIPDITGGAER